MFEAILLLIISIYLVFITIWVWRSVNEFTTSVADIERKLRALSNDYRALEAYTMATNTLMPKETKSKSRVTVPFKD